MRLWPHSLFGRLVLVLLVGLLAAQAASALLLLRDRGSVLTEASGWHVAQRTAGILRLLDSVQPEQRPAVLRALRTPALRIEFIDAPALEQRTDGLHARHLHALLRRLTESEMPLRVQLSTREDDETLARHAAAPERMGRRAERFARWRAELVSFHVEARLGDGTWVSLAQRVPEEQFLLPGKLLIALLVLLFSVVALSLLAVRWMTRPLRLFGEAAEALGKDIDRPPLAESGPLEVRRAAQAFNTMQGRIQRYIQDRERMLAAVSHDLRTPITRLRLRAELLDDETLRAKILQDLAEMQGMTDGALDLIRGTPRDEPERDIDIQALLESIQTDREDMGQSMQLTGTAAPYRGRPIALRRCIENLIENAMKFAGAVSVRLEDGPEQLTVRVSDQGPGIPDQALAHVFEPFYRLEGSRSRETGGVGLGLGIAYGIARAHGGDLTLRNRTEGGLEAVLTLSRAARRATSATPSVSL